MTYPTFNIVDKTIIFSLMLCYSLTEHLRQKPTKYTSSIQDYNSYISQPCPQTMSKHYWFCIKNVAFTKKTRKGRSSKKSMLLSFFSFLCCFKMLQTLPTTFHSPPSHWHGGRNQRNQIAYLKIWWNTTKTIIMWRCSLCNHCWPHVGESSLFDAETYHWGQ